MQTEKHLYLLVRSCNCTFYRIYWDTAMQCPFLCTDQNSDENQIVELNKGIKYQERPYNGAWRLHIRVVKNKKIGYTMVMNFLGCSRALLF